LLFSTRYARTAIKQTLHKIFVASQRLGVSVLPLHFYSSIPDVRDLRGRNDWKEPRSMCGINLLSIDEQIALLDEIMPSIISASSRDLHAEAVAENGVDGGYGVIETDVLAAFVASRRPPRIVQVGCGVSTAVVLAAARIADYRPNLICIDPYPTNYLKRTAAEGAITLLPKPAQVVEIEVLTALGEGDLLFIDSTHTVKPGSEVNRIVLEVLPRLNAGVHVHFHDIYFPYEYARNFLSGDLFFPGETSLLYAFMLNNPKFRIDLCLSMLHYAAPHAMKKLMPKFEPQENDAGLAASGGRHFPSSIYLVRIA
jgi:hypothetical protein